MAKKSLNINDNSQQLKIDFEIVDKITIKQTFETKIISISSRKIFSQINVHYKEKIYKDIINNSKSY